MNEQCVLFDAAIFKRPVSKSPWVRVTEARCPIHGSLPMTHDGRELPIRMRATTARRWFGCWSCKRAGKQVQVNLVVEAP